MASFDPSPGNPNDPNYTNIFRPVQEPQADVSKGMVLKGAGETLQGGVALADTLIKKGLSNDIYEKVDKERDQFTAGLEAVKSQLDNGQIASPVRTASGGTVGKSIFDAHAEATDADLPAGLDSGLDRITQLTLAKQMGSIKLNDTQYAGNVLAVAKQLRTQFPGYREYIDQQVSQASGLPVANSYYQNLMLDVNRQLNAMQTKKDDVGSMMEKNMDTPNMGVYIVQRANNDPKYPGDAKIIEKIASWQNLQTQQKIDAAKRAEAKDQKVDLTEMETTNLSSRLNETMFQHISDNLSLSGMSSLRNLLTYFDDAAAGRINVSDTEVQQRALQLQAYYGYIKNGMKAAASGSGAIIGDDKVDNMIKSAMSPIQTYIDLVNQKDGPLAHFHLNQVQAIKDDDVHDWLTNHDFSATARQLQAARATFGEQYFPQWVAGILKGGLDKPIQDLFTEEAMSAVQPITDQRGQPVQTRAMIDAVKHAKEVGVPDYTYYGKVTGLIGGITDPQMPLDMKDRMVNWAFDKKNIGILNEFKSDYYDAQGNFVPGKEAAFRRMSSPAISKAVAETSSVHPENYQKYMNWNESEFGSIYRSQVQTLNKQMQEYKDLGLHYGFNNSANHFILMDNKNNPLSYDVRGAVFTANPRQFQINQMVQTLDKINDGLDNMTKVYENNPMRGKDNKDLPTYLLKVLQTSGFRPGSGVTNASENMARAIIKTENPDLPISEIDQRLFGPGVKYPGQLKPVPKAGSRYD